VERRERRQPGGQACWIPFEGRREVLDEIHLVDVPAGDRLLHGLDCGCIAGVGPRAVPGTDAETPCPIAPLGRMADATGGEREPAWLGGQGRGRIAPEDLREPIPEEHVGDLVTAEELALPKVILHPREGVLRVPELEHGSTLVEQRQGAVHGHS
jgi:hypothetical protein